MARQATRWMRSKVPAQSCEPHSLSCSKPPGERPHESTILDEQCDHKAEESSTYDSEDDLNGVARSQSVQEGSKSIESGGQAIHQQNSGTKESLRQLKNTRKLGLTPAMKLFSCGCGEFKAEQLCNLLLRFGIRSVLDVRALPKSKKKPWFDCDNLAKSMRAAGLTYHFVGKGRKSHTVVAGRAEKCNQDVCLLGFRASPMECARLVLSQKMLTGLGWQVTHLVPSCDDSGHDILVAQPHSEVFAQYSASMQQIQTVQCQLERKYGFLGHWRDRVIARYGSLPYDQWDGCFSALNPTVITLPWGSVIAVLPNFKSGTELRNLQKETLPGAVTYEQPRRKALHGKATYIDQHKEAWFCADYDFADPRRQSAPFAYRRQELRPWSEGLLADASLAAESAFNGFMCRWEPPGEMTVEGPLSFSRGSPMPEYTTVAFLGICGSRHLRVHGLGCWEKLALDVHIPEGTLVVFGGPLKERWLHVHLRDEAMRGERVLMTLMVHAHAVSRAQFSADSSGIQKSGSDATQKPTIGTLEGSASSTELCAEQLFAATRRGRWKRAVE
eukprot:TRINITY_DN24710_c0_g1_i1.p1 TRINITY_DN24710_c0_g1~~TRINITY_DN24710_c0_g1_i1.p1  ORF type:complete len:557 (+),score=32.45 TRINITY_DN24710_c0_g1_i1:209-1879(+)